MYGGTIVETGPITEVIANPRHPYTRALLACEIDSSDDGPLRSIAGEVPDPVASLAGCVFAPRCHYTIAACHTEIPTLMSAGQGRQLACLRASEALA